MTQHEINTVLLAVAAVGQTWFTARYALLPWWTAPLGRALFINSLVLALVLDVVVISRLVNWPHEGATMTALFALLVVGILVRYVAFDSLSRKERRDRE